MIYVLFGEGFEEVEALTPVDLLRRAELEVKLTGIAGLTVTGSHGIQVQMDITLDQVRREDLEMVVLPGGLVGVENLAASEAVRDLLTWAAREGKLIGAICAAPSLLAQLGILQGRRSVIYPGMEDKLEAGGALFQMDERVTHDRNIITAQAAGSSVEFALKLIAMMRGWAASETVRKAIHFHGADRSLT